MILIVEDLLQELAKYPRDMRVMILDQPNGSGCPRDINLGPGRFLVTAEDAATCSDCEGLVGKSVVVLCFGCY